MSMCMSCIVVQKKVSQTTILLLSTKREAAAVQRSATQQYMSRALRGVAPLSATL